MINVSDDGHVADIGPLVHDSTNLREGERERDDKMNKMFHECNHTLFSSCWNAPLKLILANKSLK